jgi:hypothetical protein
MSGAIAPLHQYVFMAWCLVKAQVQLYLLPRREGVLGEWRYSSTHSLTSALDAGEWLASRPGRSLWYPLDSRMGGPQSLSGRGGGKFPAPAGNRTLEPRSSSP